MTIMIIGIMHSS